MTGSVGKKCLAEEAKGEEGEEGEGGLPTLGAGLGLLLCNFRLLRRLGWVWVCTLLYSTMDDTPGRK